MAIAPDPPTAVQDRSRRTRRELLDAGFRLLAVDGLDALTIGAVSNAAGVAAGTVYRRFGDKDGLIRELQAEFTAGFRAELGARMAAAHTGDDQPAVVIDRAVRALTDTFRDHETLLRVFVMVGMQDARMADTGERASHEGGRLFHDLLWTHRDVFTAADPAHAIDIVHRLVYAACMHRVLHGPRMESPTSLSWGQLTDELSRTAVLYLLSASAA